MNIQKACKVLMIKEPFYGLFLTTLNKVITTDVPTLAVGLSGINTILYINQKYWNSLNDLEQIAILKHELMHLCFFHLTMRSSFKNHNILNIAADLEINQYIENLPKDIINLKYFEELGIDLPIKSGTKVYYELLEKEAEKVPQFEDCEGDHSKWSDFDKLSESEKTLVEKQLDYSIKHTAENIIKQQGKIPRELRDKIDDLFKTKQSVFNWKSYLRRVVGNSIMIYTKKSQRKLSIRFEDYAGLKIKKKHNVLVAIDTSGSIANEELAEFFSEINHIYKSGAMITIIESDAKIGKIYEYKGKPDLKLTGGGGTSFIPVIEYYNENRNKYSTLVYFTDGCANIKNLQILKKMIWLISSNGDQEKNYPGLTIKIPKK